MKVVGLGTQDDLAYAHDFVDSYDLTLQMLWDPGFESWRELGVFGQPAAMLLAPDGERLDRWQGAFDEDEVLELARRY